VYEAAEVDGAGPWRQFAEVTIPLLRPALLVACLFRMLDAFRVFDIVYVMTGGGPGTATEPIAFYAFSTLMQSLRFGYGSALSAIIFVVVFLFALASLRVFGGNAFQDRSA
jgi:ABC-type sugar transport system permease subunit